MLKLESTSWVERDPASGLNRVSKQTRIAVLNGGVSSEREVSLRSGKNCYEALVRLGYENVVRLDVGPEIAQDLRVNQIELAFLALHGEGGEDGTIQGLLELMGIAYTGNRVQASAVTMDKVTTKRLLKEAGLPVLETRLITCQSWQEDAQAISAEAEALGFPLMVKPLSTGSSVGMSKVKSFSDFASAMENAFHHGERVMLEPFALGRDLTVGVIQAEGQLKVTPILELKSHRDWYDYEAKYTAGQTSFILPAPMPEDWNQAVQNCTLQAHQSLGCHGVSRTDFVLREDGSFVILEVNSIPGMTDLSDLPAQCKAMGMSYDELVDCLLHSAVQAQSSAKERSLSDSLV